MKSYVYKCKYFSRNIFLILVIVVALFLGSMNIKSMVQDLVFAGDDTTADFNSAKDVTLVGNGSQSLPYLISSVDDFKFVIKKVNNAISSYQTAYYKLTTDLNFSNTKTYSLGYVSAYFKGTFDGGNNHIKNINVTCARGNCGLFGYIQGATIKNLKLDSGTVQLKANNSSGSLVGAVKGLACTIDNCGNYGVTIQQLAENTNACASGLIGYVDTNLTVTNCFNHATIKNSVTNVAYAGGIVARVNNSSAIVNVYRCYNIGNITAGTGTTSQSYAGGIIGHSIATNSSADTANKAVVQDCYNRGYICANASYIKSQNGNRNSEGQFVSGSYSLYVKDNVVTTIWDSLGYCGGICGKSDGPAKNCYNIGTISGGTKYFYLDGSVFYARQGYSGAIKAVYPINNFYISRYSNGIQNGGTVTSCFSNMTFRSMSTEDLSQTVQITSGERGDDDIGYAYTAPTQSVKINGINQSLDIIGQVGYSWNSYYKYWERVKINGDSVYYKSFYCRELKLNVSYSNNMIRIWYNYVCGEGDLYSYSKDLINTSYMPVTAWTYKNANQIKELNMGSNWAIDSKLNDGYPHLKSFYWQDNAEDLTSGSDPTTPTPGPTPGPTPEIM